MLNITKAKMKMALNTKFLQFIFHILWMPKSCVQNSVLYQVENKLSVQCVLLGLSHMQCAYMFHIFWKNQPTEKKIFIFLRNYSF